MRRGKGKRYFFKKQTKAYIGKRLQPLRLKWGNPKWRERINEAFFWEIPKELKRKERIRDVHKETTYQAVKEKRHSNALCVKALKKTTEEELCLSQTDTESHLQSDCCQQEKWRSVHS